MLQQAWQWAKTITVDTPSASNLVKMFTSAALGTDDIRAYIVCGGDTRWVEPLLQAFRKRFPNDYTDTSQSTLFSPMGAYSYKIFYDRIATIIDQYEPHHIAIVLTERITGLDTLQKQKNKQYGFIRVRKDLPTDTYSQWEQFIADEGRYAFLLLSCNLWRKQKTSVHTVNLDTPNVFDVCAVRDLESSGCTKFASEKLARQVGAEYDRETRRYVLVDAESLHRKVEQYIKMGVDFKRGVVL